MVHEKRGGRLPRWACSSNRISYLGAFHHEKAMMRLSFIIRLHCGAGALYSLLAQKFSHQSLLEVE